MTRPENRLMKWSRWCTTSRNGAAYGLTGIVLLVLCAWGSAAERESVLPLIFFRADYADTVAASTGSTVVTPRETTDISFVDGDHSRAVEFGEGDWLVYDLPEGFPVDSGSLELLFRADFPQTAEEAGRTVLRLRGDGDHELRLFYVPVGSCWRFRLEDSLFAQTGRRSVEEGKWCHLLLTWDSTAEPRPVTRLYVNGGGGRGYDYTPPDAPLMLLELGGSKIAQISVDAMAIYTRALTHDQATFLVKVREEGRPPYAALAERVAADDQVEAERRKRRREQLARLEGKVGRLIHLRGKQPQDFELPEGITATGIRPEDVGEIDLKQFRVIYFPQGTAYQLDDEQQQIIFEYVANGGGYVGSCAGANFAHKIKLLEFRRYTFLGSAIWPILLEPHAVTEGYGGSVAMHHGNGPIMFPGEGCRAVGTYRIPTEPDDPPPGAILVGMQGKGRVVLFGPHPLGGGVKGGGKIVPFSGKLLETDRMLVNALLYAAGIVGEDWPSHEPRKQGKD